MNTRIPRRTSHAGKSREGRSTSLASLPCLIALALALPAAHAATMSTGEDGRRIYTAEHFERFAPRNAFDMLSQLPGFVIREQAQTRGLGQATGNVLLNGQRISGKDNEILVELRRIAAENVLRIELVDGATLDIPGLSGQVANVVTVSTGRTGQYTWSPEFRARNTDPRLSNFAVSVSGRNGRLEHTLGLDNASNHAGADGPTVIRDRDGALIEERHEAWTSEYNQPRISARFALRPEVPSGVASEGEADTDEGEPIANLNLSYRRIDEDFREDGLRTGPGRVDRERDVRSIAKGYGHEVGGDYAFALGGGQMKLIGLSKGRTIDRVATAITRFADGSPDAGDRFDRDSVEDERIARGEYRWSRGVGDWQVSGEAAFNSLDNVARLFVLGADGELQPVPLPGSSARVEEDRYELMGSYGRPIGNDWTVNLSAGAEHSRLEQVGEGGQARTFLRPKGLLTAAWRVSPDTDVSFKLERRVGQLNFFDFLATVNLTDELENAGNPDLRPSQIWDLQSEVTRRMGDWGSTSLRGYVVRVDDQVDVVPIGDTGESPGNIGTGSMWGVEWKGTLNLGGLGWEGGRIDTRVIHQRSRVNDPLTGERRPMSNSLEDFAQVTLRHDPPGSNWGWGGGMSYEYRSRSYRLTEQGRMWEGPVWANVYLEHKDVMGLTVRGTLNNLLGGTSMWDRTVHEGRRTDPVAFHEQRDRLIGPIFTLSIRGEF